MSGARAQRAGMAVAAWLIVLLQPPGIAIAQPQGAMDQVAQPPARAGIAASPPQIGRPTTSDRATVGQLPSNLTERAGAPATPPDGAAPPSHPAAPPLAPARNAASVDPDEIARLLARGEAASIDAAAAIATGLAPTTATTPAEPDMEPDPSRMRMRTLPPA